MNKEEKKAIEDMDRFANGIDMSGVSASQIQIILNLIEKLQKENEELKLKYKLLYNGKIEMIKARELKIPNLVVSKQKIKDKIEHYQKLQGNYIEKYDEINEGLQAMINALQELLEGRE